MGTTRVEPYALSPDISRRHAALRFPFSCRLKAIGLKRRAESIPRILASPSTAFRPPPVPLPCLDACDRAPRVAVDPKP